MLINSQNLVSISEANQNFSKIARLVDQNGSAIILKNNKPRYVLVDYDTLQQETSQEPQNITQVATNILSRHIKAFEELAK